MKETCLSEKKTSLSENMPLSDLSGKTFLAEITRHKNMPIRDSMSLREKMSFSERTRLRIKTCPQKTCLSETRSQHTNNIGTALTVFPLKVVLSSKKKILVLTEHSLTTQTRLGPKSTCT